MEMRLSFSKLTIWVLDVQQLKNQKWCLARRKEIKEVKWESKSETGNDIYMVGSVIYNCGAVLKVSSVSDASEASFDCKTDW